MATTLAELVFFACALAIALALGAILRSTQRGMARSTAVKHPMLEWVFALLPAVALVVVLALTWRAMHPETVQGSGVTPSGIRA